MSCSAMLDQILEADLDVLEGKRDSELARHVRECLRCEAIARQIVADTQVLGVAVVDARATIKVVTAASEPAFARSRGLNVGRIAVVAGLAAALCVVVTREWARHERSQVVAIETRRANGPTPGMPPAAVLAARPQAGHVRRGHAQRSGVAEAQKVPPRFVRATPQAVATAAERTVVKPLGLPSSVAPVRLDTATNVALGSAVAVDPPTGVRADIIRTPNPTVTVVWLYQ